MIPREPNEPMRDALDAFLRAAIQGDHERGDIGVICIKAWRVMHDAAEESQRSPVGA
jgi:hypothetical protein